MRVLFAAVLALGVFASSAAAQEISDPTARVHVILDDSWELIDPAQDSRTAPETVFFAEQSGEYPLAFCELTLHTNRLPGPQTRERLNAATADLLQNSPTIANYRNQPNMTVESTTLNDLSGITVLDIRVRRQFLVGIERRFILQGPGQLQLYTLVCGAHPEDDEARAQAFNAADSLRVLDESR